MPGLEAALTVACARMLELETESIRLERRIHALAERATQAGVGEQMSALARDRHAAGAELSLLRSLVRDGMAAIDAGVRQSRS